MRYRDKSAVRCLERAEITIRNGLHPFREATLTRLQRKPHHGSGQELVFDDLLEMQAKSFAIQCVLFEYMVDGYPT